MSTQGCRLYFIVLLLLFAVPAESMAAAPWPEKPVRIILPWPPGGSTDIVGRLIAAELSSRLKQQVIIDNRAGAGGIVGMQIATASPPDGYTLMLTSTAYGYLIDKQEVPVDIVKSFAPVALIGLEPLITYTVAVSLPSQPPHPNSAKLFTEWLLSREGQEVVNQY